MALLTLWASNPDAIISMSIGQILAIAGDGDLRDDSECSIELRDFFSQVPSEKLADYVNTCLASGFSNSGFILQDVVNELGRRLDYTVINGRYRGSPNTIGNDGLWKSPEGHDILVEVKTSDVHRIPLNTIAKYRDRLLDNGELGEAHSMLLVVGRENTGELEAQVRGSRYAWDMRLISVDSLIRLVKLKESTEGVATGAKIRSILVPMEYTRLDALIDVMFAAAKDVESAVDAETQPAAEEDDERSGWVFTDPALIQQKRDQIINALGKLHGVRLVRRSRALHWSTDHAFRAVCTVSKRYMRRSNTRYWYAYHPQWDEFLNEADTGFFVLGCMDLNMAFALPLEILRAHLHELNTTTREDGSSYWHIKILEAGPQTFILQMPVTGNHLPLSSFAFKLD